MFNSNTHQQFDQSLNDHEGLSSSAKEADDIDVDVKRMLDVICLRQPCAAEAEAVDA